MPGAPLLAFTRFHACARLSLASAACSRVTGCALTPLEYHLSMDAVSGTVVGGKILVERLSLTEGTVATVLTPADDTLVKLPPHLEQELLDAIDEADQEVGGAGPEFLESLKRYG